MASTQSDYLKDLYKSWAARMGAEPQMELDTLRDMFEDWHLPTRRAHRRDLRGGRCRRRPGHVCTPTGCARRPGRCSGPTAAATSSAPCTPTARWPATWPRPPACRALVIDYRRAPEHPHPAQVEDAVTSYRWLLGQGVQPGHVATTGDSAGGSLCTSMVLRLRDEGDPLPAAIMPISPWYDMEAKGETLDSRADVGRAGPAGRAVGHGDDVPRATAPGHGPAGQPAYADPRGLPPMLIQVGDHESLLDDSHRFAAWRADAGVDVTVEVEPEMQHVFHFLAGRAPEADEAIARMAAWVRPKLGLR